MNKTILSLSLLFMINISESKELIISKKTQTFILRDEQGLVIKTGKVSTGKHGHETPSGQFVIRSKDKYAFSNRYKSKMYNALFFQSKEYAIHRGHIPDNHTPISHGCVRVSYSDSEFLFDNVSIGTTLLIKNK